MGGGRCREVLCVQCRAGTWGLYPKPHPSPFPCLSWDSVLLNLSKGCLSLPKYEGSLTGVTVAGEEPEGNPPLRCLGFLMGRWRLRHSSSRSGGWGAPFRAGAGPAGTMGSLEWAVSCASLPWDQPTHHRSSIRGRQLEVWSRLIRDTARKRLPTLWRWEPPLCLHLERGGAAHPLRGPGRHVPAPCTPSVPLGQAWGPGSTTVGDHTATTTGPSSAPKPLQGNAGQSLLAAEGSGA